MRVRSRPSFLRLLWLVFAVAWVGCQAGPDAPLGVDPPATVEPKLAKGGQKGGPGEDSSIEVRRADPDTALQGAALEVRVLGAGFEEGATVSFEIDGKPVNDIVVHSTRFVDSTELVADISVAVDARVTRYDIAVLAGRGKKGIGLELFAVKYNGPPHEDPLSVVIVDGYDVAPDGGGSYVHEVEDVSSLIFGSGNFGLDVRGANKGRGNKKGSDRTIAITLRDAATGTILHEATIDANVTTGSPDLEGGLRALENGQSMTTQLRFLWEADDRSGQWLRYGSRCGLEASGEWIDDPGSRAVVSASLGGWTIEGLDAYWCLGGDPEDVAPHPDTGPDGRVVASLRFEVRKIFP